METIEHYDESELNDFRLQWTHDKVECQDCGYVWIAVHALGADTNHLECTKCGSFKSDLYEAPNTWEPAPMFH